ncbi:DUF3616 domain-containing protein [Nannocystis bainbridge]|uniref:DUF3616 domain-containing protein n=1 Tax=Nannocystis bainbridge TaxID=2995303 RepID=A0ABT5DUZ0_9BACT|nr:DUF3616 domain-containing protein [Nannocystis bainbridge]MDC0717460.1 DUF3616 domain-containing protein [Nannocystis bainbridge]
MHHPRCIHSVLSFVASGALAFMLTGCEDGDDDAVLARAGGPVSVSFQDGQAPTSSYAGTRDTMLDGDSPSATHGTDTALSVEADTELVALLSWDLSAAIPTTAVVESVTITLEISDKSPEVFSLYEARRAWNEANATWKVWNTGSNWQTAGGHGAADRGSVALGSFSAADTGAVTFSLNAAGVALVQQWVESPASNRGFFLDGAGTSNRLEFRASEYGTRAKRPRLTVTWHEADAGDTDGALDPTPGNYKQSCDGSFAVALDGTYFLDGNDENQGLRVYRRGADANAARTIDVSASIGLSSSDEADLEDAARIGDRIYVVSSHGRNKSGKLERMRYRFFAFDVAGAAPNVSLSTVGYTSKLLDDMVKAANWLTPNASVIATLAAATNLSKTTDADLAPKLGGANIEGLAWLPTPQRPKQLVIGFRNPLQGTDAILVTLLDADAALSGAVAQFGEAVLLDLGGLRVRGMTWSPAHAAMLILAGPKDGTAGPYRLYKWSGVATQAPVLVHDITSFPTNSGPESVVVYPGSHDVQIVFDQGEHPIDGKICKDNPLSSQFFSDAIVHVP